jgi:hypothetical protein
MMKEKDTKTAAELMAELSADPRYLARQVEQEEDRQRRVAEWREAERPLIEELRQGGLAVNSVWDLVNTSKPYPGAIPVLLDHLQRLYPARVREGIARALAVPEARRGWNVLLDSFLQEEDQTAQGPKWALACALGAAADDDVLTDVIDLLQDRRHGENRIPLLAALAGSQRPSARLKLLELRGDPDLAADVERLLNGEEE